MSKEIKFVELSAREGCMKSGEFVEDDCKVKICCANLESDEAMSPLLYIDDGKDIGKEYVNQFVHDQTVAKARSDMNKKTMELREKHGIGVKPPKQTFEECRKCFLEWAEVLDAEVV